MKWFFFAQKHKILPNDLKEFVDNIYFSSNQTDSFIALILQHWSCFLQSSFHRFAQCASFARCQHSQEFMDSMFVTTVAIFMFCSFIFISILDQDTNFISTFRHMNACVKWKKNGHTRKIFSFGDISCQGQWIKNNFLWPIDNKTHWTTFVQISHIYNFFIIIAWFGLIFLTIALSIAWSFQWIKIDSMLDKIGKFDQISIKIDFLTCRWSDVYLSSSNQFENLYPYILDQNNFFGRT